MKRNAALAALARRVASSLLLAAALLFAVPAQAGDRALVDIIGYSPDSRYFAFEEFGIQAGSGFAYSTIYVVDLSSDSWVEGTPVHEQADDETTDLSDIRAMARDAAGAYLEDTGIDAPAHLVAHIADGELDEEADALTFGIPGYTGPGAVIGQYTLALSSFPADSPQPCKDYLGKAALGYELVISSDGEDRVLHRDERLPRSRGCPMDYRLYGVVLPFEASDLTGSVALISVYPFGFEGPDRRFIALPLAP
jgi:predicted secreted protein